MEQELTEVTQRIPGTTKRRILGTVTYDEERDRYLAASVHSLHCDPAVFYDLRQAIRWVVREDNRHLHVGRD